MGGSNAIEVAGAVLEALPNKLYRVKLPNGHQVMAYVAGRRRDQTSFAAGEKVILEMSFYDLSQGRIKLTEKK